MKTLILSGGIGSGKSVVAALLAAHGIPVYDCDNRAKALYDEVPGLLERIETALGCPLRGEDGRLDPKRLGGRIFSDPAAREQVESILYPELKADFLRWRSRQSAPWAALESAIILSKPLFDDIGDLVVWVHAPAETRLRRAVLRDGSSEESVLARMRAQENFASRADEVLVNDGSLQELSDKVDRLVHKLT